MVHKPTQPSLKQCGQIIVKNPCWMSLKQMPLKIGKVTMVSYCQCCISWHITGKEVNFQLSIQILYITQGWLKHSFSTTQQTFWVMSLVHVITRCIDNCGILSRYRISNLFRTSYCLLPLSLTTRSSPLNPQDLNTCKTIEGSWKCYQSLSTFFRSRFHNYY